MQITKTQLKRIIKEELEAVLEAEGGNKDFVFMKDGQIAFYLINTPPHMLDGDKLKSVYITNQHGGLPAHDTYKVFGPSPAVMTNADLYRDGKMDRVIDASTIAIPQTKEEVYAAAGLSPQEIRVANNGVSGKTDIFDQKAYEKLYEYFAFDGPPAVRMPYTTAKARDEDPYDWVMTFLRRM